MAAAQAGPAHLVAVVGRGEDRDAVAVVLHLVPLLLHLHAHGHRVSLRAKKKPSLQKKARSSHKTAQLFKVRVRL